MRDGRCGGKELCAVNGGGVSTSARVGLQASDLSSVSMLTRIDEGKRTASKPRASAALSSATPFPAPPAAAAPAAFPPAAAMTAAAAGFPPRAPRRFSRRSSWRRSSCASASRVKPLHERRKSQMPRRKGKKVGEDKRLRKTDGTFPLAKMAFLPVTACSTCKKGEESAQGKRYGNEGRDETHKGNHDHT